MGYENDRFATNSLSLNRLPWVRDSQYKGREAMDDILSDRIRLPGQIPGGYLCYPKICPGASFFRKSRGIIYGSKFSKIGIQPSLTAGLYSSIVRRVQLTPFTPQMFRTR